MPRKFIPERGDIVWLSFNPHAGHEQAGRRPAITVSPKLYNEKPGLGIFCPITSNVKGYPFEVNVPSGFKIQGVILSDQVKSLDWKARNAEFICESNPEMVQELQNKLKTLIE